MNGYTEKAKQQLLESGYTFVLVKGEQIFTSNGRAVATLMQLLREDSSLLKDSYIADRVIGKAAAMIMHYGGVKEIYADMISDPAVAYLEKHSLPFYYGQRVSNILNRDKSDLCPMERLCLNLDCSQTAYEEIKSFMNAQ